MERVARWDGAAWHAVGSGVTRSGRSAAVADLGAGPVLCVGGSFVLPDGSLFGGVMTWNGRPALAAPSRLFRRPRGTGRPATFFLQGVIADRGSAETKPASVTNGARVEVR